MPRLNYLIPAELDDVVIVSGDYEGRRGYVLRVEGADDVVVEVEACQAPWLPPFTQRFYASQLRTIRTAPFCVTCGEPAIAERSGGWLCWTHDTWPQHGDVWEDIESEQRFSVMTSHGGTVTGYWHDAAGLDPAGHDVIDPRDFVVEFRLVRREPKEQQPGGAS